MSLFFFLAAYFSHWLISGHRSWNALVVVELEKMVENGQAVATGFFSANSRQAYLRSGSMLCWLIPTNTLCFISICGDRESRVIRL